MNPLARAPSAAVRAMDRVVLAGLFWLLLAGSLSCAPDLPASATPPPASGPGGSRTDPDPAWQKLSTEEAAVRTYVVYRFPDLRHCPSDRIQVAECAECAEPPPSPVPPTIAADPTRLAPSNRDPRGDKYFEATGCGRWHAFRCTLPVTGKRSCQVDKEAALEDTYHELLSDTHVVGMGMGLSSLPSRHLEVESVYPGSPGEGKLQPGDEIVAAEGTTVAEPSELLAIWHDHRGGSLHLDVQRDGVVQTVVLSLPPLRK